MRENAGAEEAEESGEAKEVEEKIKGAGTETGAPGVGREIGTSKGPYFALNVAFCTLNSPICTLTFPPAPIVHSGFWPFIGCTRTRTRFVR